MKPKWKKHEEQDAKDFGGSRNKGSGNSWFLPGDVKSQKFLIDSKYTDKASFTITKKIWDKIYEEALFSFRNPILSIQIQDLELIVMSKEDFLKEMNKE